MEESHIHNSVVETLTEKPKFEITIPITWCPDADVAPDKSNLIQRIKAFFRAKLKPKSRELERTFVIYPCKLGNMYRIAGRAALLPNEIFEDDPSQNLITVIDHHIDDVIYVLATAIQNNHLEPSKDLIEFLKWNLDSYDYEKFLIPALRSLNMMGFLNSIVLIKGTEEILKTKTSPKDGSELIASHMPQ